MKRNHALAAQMMRSGLKCDAPGCGFQDATIQLNWTTVRTMVGLSCPKCGASLLTKEDSHALMFMMVVMEIVNLIYFPIMLVNEVLFLFRLKRRPPWVVSNVKLNGSGKIKLSDPKPPPAE